MTHLTSDRLEQETDESRERVALLLDELRQRVSPGEVVDQLYDYAREGAGGDFVRTFGNQVRNNPLAVGLIGAGIGWLMMSERKALRARGYDHPDYREMNEADAAALGGMTGSGPGAAERARRAYHGASDGMKRAYDSAASGVSEIGSSTASMASRASGAVTDAAESVKETASEASQAFSEGAAAAREKAADFAARGREGASRIAETGSRYAEQLSENPLVLAGIGLALGAVFGALLPSTQRENELMGAASDDLKEKAVEFGQEQYDKVETVVEKTAEQAMSAASEAADEVGLVPSVSTGETLEGEALESKTQDKSKRSDGSQAASAADGER